jgi:hypothetical protein
MTDIQRHVRIALTLVAAAVIAGCAHHVSGGPARRWELRGAIVTVTDQHVAVRHKTGQIVDLLLDDRTLIVHDRVPQGRDALSRGRRVRVEVEPLASGGSLARVVHVYGGGS